MVDCWENGGVIGVMVGLLGSLWDYLGIGGITVGDVGVTEVTVYIIEVMVGL